MTSPDRQTLALCVPAYNAAAHLPRLFESVRAQSRPFDEILVYDDASSDDTSAVARRLGAKVVRVETNTGPSAGKNRLAEVAATDWVHFHDADDALGPEFVERSLPLMGSTDDVVLFDTEDRDDATGAVLGVRHWDQAPLRDDAVRYNILNTVTNCGIYRRDAFLRSGGFDHRDATKYNEDQAMHMRLALSGLRFAAAGYVGVIIYRRSGSMSSGHPIECARAQYELLAGVADATGTRYASEIGQRLWVLAGVLGGYRDWAYARRCLTLAAGLGYVDPVAEHPVLRLLARVSPVGAIRTREAIIRTFKPALRRGMPTVSRS